MTTETDRHATARAFDETVVVGCGGVGLPFAVALAATGSAVLGVDIDPARVAALNAGRTDQVDDGLESALRAAVEARALRFAEGISPSERRRAFVVAVPTPVDEQHRFDRSALDGAVDAIVANARDGDLVIVRSTVPVGTLRRIAASATAQGRALAFAACPDRSTAGRALAEQRSLPNVVGGLTAEAATMAAALLAPLGPVRTVSRPETAEALKLFTNVWRDARFALANEFASFCERAGIDYDEVRAAGTFAYPRFDIPRAGPVGGPCLTKDAYLLAASANAVGATIDVARAARRRNADLVDAICARVLADVARQGGAATVAVLGLAFKGTPAVADRRGSLGVALVDALRAASPALSLRAWDPVSDSPQAARTAIGGATIVVLANDHPALAQASLLDGCAPGAVVHDLCGMLSPAHAKARGWTLRRFGDGREGPQ